MLNREKGSIPLYMQLEMALRKNIEQGKYGKGDFFPTEKELMEMYQVSRVTVRQAMARLVQTGYIRIRRGIGTDVVYDKIEEQIEGVVSFTEEMRKHNIFMTTSYCKMELIKPSEQVAQKCLEVEAQMPIFIRTRQTFLSDGEIYEYSKCYYPGNRYKYTVDL